NSVAALRDIPGLILASPARPDDAAAMLRTCLAAAAADGSMCVFLEPIALYHTRDLLAAGDGGWRVPYDPPDRWASGHVPVGRGRTHGGGTDLTIVTFGNGLWLSLRAADRPAGGGVGCPGARPRRVPPVPARPHSPRGAPPPRGPPAGRGGPPHRGRVRGGARGAGRRRLRGPGSPGDERGQLRPARRRGSGRTAVPAGDRGRRAVPGPLTPGHPPILLTMESGEGWFSYSPTAARRPGPPRAGDGDTRPELPDVG